MSIDVVSLPLIGAFIGYFTNYVAIKMLFYPKKPYYIGKVRVPFTPGLIPKKRDEIIEKIADVVEKKIINKDELIRYIYSKRNRIFLYDYTDKLLNELLEKKLSSLNIPYKKFTPIIESLIEEKLKPLIDEKISDITLDINYITYNAFLLIDKTETVESLIGSKTKEKINSNIEILSIEALNRLSDSLDDPKIKEIIRKKIVESLDSYIDESNILTASFVSMLAPLIEENDRIIEIIIEKLQALLKDKEIKKRVVKSIKESMDENIFKLNLEEFLIKYTGNNLEDTRKLLTEKLDSIIDNLNLKEKIKNEILKLLDSKKLARKSIAFLKLNMSKISFGDVIEFINPKFKKKMSRYIINNLLIIIKGQSQKIFDFSISENAKKKLKSLDIGQVEEIVLNISKEQFKYINLFGGILGFLIGIIELILR
ncbi:DUF445 family protein [Hippea alviniae]|uniref:DUF445 family protein n=1 Tax=Hippea alviniae TaxID=1279027 RepID=UPI0003B30B16|nr:DUF445 family protein [Hippea alviniae]